MPRPRDWYDVKGYWSLSARTYWNRATIRRTACFFHVVHLMHGFENYWTSSRLPLEYLSALKGEISSRPAWIIFNNSIAWIARDGAVVQAPARGIRSVIPFVFHVTRTSRLFVAILVKILWKILFYPDVRRNNVRVVSPWILSIDFYLFVRIFAEIFSTNFENARHSKQNRNKFLFPRLGIFRRFFQKSRNEVSVAVCFSFPFFFRKISGITVQ